MIGGDGGGRRVTPGEPAGRASPALAFDRRGRGPVLVLLHALGTDRRMWDPVLERLAAERDVIALDLPGFGGSPVISPAAPADLARAVAAQLAGLGVERPHVAGNSLGGWVAFELGLMGAARSVTAIAPAGLWPQPLRPRRSRARALARALRPLLPLVVRSARGRRAALSGSIAHPERVPPRAALQLVRAYADAPGFDAADAGMRAGRFTGMSRIRVPVTLVWPDRDRIVARPRALPPGVREVVLRDCGHLPTWDDPAQVADVLLSGSRRLGLRRDRNPHRDPAYAPGPLAGDPRAFHRTLPGYAPAPLIPAPELAREWGVPAVYLKDESARFGLPSFKALGASWAVHRALQDADPHTLVCATDGNHGRAVAWMARRRGLAAHVLVPAGTAPARIDAIAGEGALVEVVDGDYDEAVRRSAALADADHLLVSDTSWPGYTEIPGRVVEGYATIFAELEEQLPEPPAAVFVPVGVGALAAAAARALRPGPARLVAVEPESADCLRRSIAAGEPVTVPGPHASVMAGLNCGTPSALAWPAVKAAFDEFLAIPDELADQGMRRLAGLGLDRGECAGGVVGAAAHAAGAEGPVVLLLTEGVTDPDHFEEVVGRPPGTTLAR